MARKAKAKAVESEPESAKEPEAEPTRPEPKRFKGSITIGKFLDSDAPRPVHIRVEDESSRVSFLDLYMTLDDFAKSLFGQYGIDCEFEVRRLNRIGTVSEHKRVEVFVPQHAWKDRYKAAREAVAVHEVDGWHGDDSDALNHYRRVKGSTDTYSVTFRRHVDPETGKPVID